MTWVEPPADFDPHSLAEFIESELVFSDDDYMSLTELRVLFAVGNQPTDDDIAFAFLEIERRGNEFGTHYPFLVDDRGVLLVRTESSKFYVFLLLMSLKGMPVRENRDFPRSDPIFDAIAREAFRAELGPHSEAIVFAWPPRDGRPTKFNEAVEWAARKIGIRPRAGEVVPEHLQDAGVDVIVWRPFPDGRNGFQLLLVQNTVQWTFRKKPYDVRVLRWFAWWHLGAVPTIGFAIPFAMPKGDIWWQDVVDGVALVLDRGRLLHALQDEDPTFWPEWSSLVQFVDAEVRAVQTAGSFSAPSTVRVPRPRRKTEDEQA